MQIQLFGGEGKRTAAGTQAHRIRAEAAQKLLPLRQGAAIEIPECQLAGLGVGAGVAVGVVGTSLCQHGGAGIGGGGVGLVPLKAAALRGQPQRELFGAYLSGEDTESIVNGLRRLHGVHRHRRFGIRIGGQT